MMGDFNFHHLRFESSVNSYGGKTTIIDIILIVKFESSVNSYGGKTHVQERSICT